MSIAFGFIWVDEGDDTFLPEYFVDGEVTIESASCMQSEGDFCKLSITIKNPLEGPLAPGRKQWAWWSWRNPAGDIEPLLRGQLIALPSDLTGERITFELMAKAPDSDAQMQAIAETLKTLPGYDPIFVDPAQRDDPNTILAAYPLLWQCDPITLEMSVSDINSGEDGLEVFNFDVEEVPYDSLRQEINQNPQRQFTVVGIVNWTQEDTNVVDMGRKVFVTYTGDGIVSEWPKVLAGLGQGWTVESSQINDTLGVTEAVVASWSSSYQNKEKEHINGDTLTVNFSASIPQVTDYLQGILTERITVGFFDPYGDPQRNDPASSQITFVRVPKYIIEGTMSIRYEAKRERSERVRFTLTSDLQATTTDSTKDHQVITKNGNDVGQPIVDVLNWLTIRDTEVAVGTVIVVSTDLEDSVYEVAVQAGRAGTVEPVFSDVVGETTVDNEVIWASLGTSLFTSVANWLPDASVTIGQIILPKAPRYINWDTLLPPAPAPTVGASVPEGLIVKRHNGASFQQAQNGGTTGLVEPAFNDTRNATTLDNSITWISLGPTLPGSAAYQIATNSGTTGAIEPAFSNTAGDITNDNGVLWQSLGTAGSFIGAPIGNTASSSFFTLDRGQDAIQYLLSFARARLLAASRAVKLTFVVPFERMPSCTLRKNGKLFDRRLPGGSAIGKIISRELHVEGGRRWGVIVLACSIGNGGTVEAVDGDNVYIDDYIDGYYATTGGTVPLPTGDIGYSRPVYRIVDDGLVFPLTRSQIVAHEETHGTLEAQKSAILSSFVTERMIANLPSQAGSEQQSVQQQQDLVRLNKKNLTTALKNNPIWYDLKIKPVVNGPFAAVYDLETTQLHPPKQIDLAAPAS